MGVYALAAAGVVVIVGLVLIVRDKIRESRQLDNITPNGSVTGEGNRPEESDLSHKKGGDAHRSVRQ